jgi:hypothetical protein
MRLFVGNAYEGIEITSRLRRFMSHVHKTENCVFWRDKFRYKFGVVTCASNDTCVNSTCTSVLSSIPN